MKTTLNLKCISLLYHINRQFNVFLVLLHDVHHVLQVFGEDHVLRAVFEELGHLATELFAVVDQIVLDLFARSQVVVQTQRCGGVQRPTGAPHFYKVFGS